MTEVEVYQRKIRELVAAGDRAELERRTSVGSPEMRAQAREGMVELDKQDEHRRRDGIKAIAEQSASLAAQANRLAAKSAATAARAVKISLTTAVLAGLAVAAAIVQIFLIRP